MSRSDVSKGAPSPLTVGPLHYLDSTPRMLTYARWATPFDHAQDEAQHAFHHSPVATCTQRLRSARRPRTITDCSLYRVEPRRAVSLPSSGPCHASLTQSGISAILGIRRRTTSLIPCLLRSTQTGNRRPQSPLTACAKVAVSVTRSGTPRLEDSNCKEDGLSWPHCPDDCRDSASKRASAQSQPAACN